MTAKSQRTTRHGKGEGGGRPLFVPGTIPGMWQSSLVDSAPLSVTSDKLPQTEAVRGLRCLSFSSLDRQEEMNVDISTQPNPTQPPSVQADGVVCSCGLLGAGAGLPTLASPHQLSPSPQSSVKAERPCLTSQCIIILYIQPLKERSCKTGERRREGGVRKGGNNFEMWAGLGKGGKCI